MIAVTLVGVLATIVAAIVAVTLVYWVVVALLIKRGRTKRAERLADGLRANPPPPPHQDWHGKQT